MLVLDLDNTLWGGVVGETGPLGVALGESPEGEAYRSFQQYLKGVAGRGVILAIASKNNLADAVEVFEKNPDMVLRLDDFGAYEICWEPKNGRSPDWRKRSTWGSTASSISMTTRPRGSRCGRL